MTQNSNRGNAPRHPRSPLPKHQQQRRTSSSPPALFATPPRKQTNWLDSSSAANQAGQSKAAFRDVAAEQVVQKNQPQQSAHKTVASQPKAAFAQPAPQTVTAMQPTPAASLSEADSSAFAALGLRAELVKAVAVQGYSTPTPIQAQAIPVVLKGWDLLGGAQTGTGKTAGFVLPLLQRLMDSPPVFSSQGRQARKPRALILAPTRELAAQVEESVRQYGQFLPLKSAVIFGGVGINPQIAAMQRGVDIVVATPGRLLDLHMQNAIDLKHVEIFVLDEADRMLDMGFIHDIRKVLAVLPTKRQNLLFSATFSDEIKALTDKLLNNPQAIEVARRNTTTEVVDQSVVLLDKGHKAKALVHLVKERNWFQVLVFTRTKHGANRLAEQLNKSAITAMAIHGNKSQGARTKALAEFKAGTLQVLVATDIAARGIDIDLLPQVVNYELPNVPEDYVHRIGRTGRAGASGQAMSLVTSEELPLLKDIEKFTRQSIPRIQLAGFNPASIADPDSPESDARDAAWTARGGRPMPRGGSGSSHKRPHPAGPGAPRSATTSARQPQHTKPAGQPPRPQAKRPTSGAGVSGGAGDRRGSRRTG